MSNNAEDKVTDNLVEGDEELLNKFDNIESDAIDEEAARRNYRWTQVEPRPARMRMSDSEDEEYFRVTFQSIAFSEHEDWNHLTLQDLYPNEDETSSGVDESEIDEASTVSSTAEEGK